MVSRIHLLLLSMLGVLLCSLPAEAARLVGWRFDRTQNRLEFSTEGQIQPRAQLIFNPTRVVVDLPGTRLDRPLVKESMAGTIRSYRIGQFDADTARIVIEVAEGYSLDPALVKVRGLGQQRWVVELPTPKPTTTGRPATLTGSRPAFQSGVSKPVSSSPPLAQAPALVVDAATQVNEVRSTPDGLFVRVTGEPPRVKIKRSRDRRTIDITIRNSALGAAQIPLPADAAKLGIKQITAEQESIKPPSTRIRLQVEPDAPDWKSTVSNFGGIVLLPTSRPKPVAGSTTSNNNPSQTNSPTSPSSSTKVATVQSLSIDRGSNQLMLQLDQAARYSTRQEANGEYVLTLSPARLARGVKAPPIYVGDRLKRVRAIQRGPQSVEIRLTPDVGVTIGEVQVPSLKLLSLPLQRRRQPGAKTGQITVIPPAGRPSLGSSRPVFSPDITLPFPSRRSLVVIDPGHGGPDPGAVGNGLKETEIVLDISRQVTAFLEAQGVQVVMTRNGEYDVDLQPRVDIAERVNATAFVSIHANAISLARPDVNGLETYYYASGKGLASSIHESVLQSVRIGDRRLRSARFYVLRRTSMPAALVETGFITGAEDKHKLADPAFRTQMAKAIARGILNYLP